MNVFRPILSPHLLVVALAVATLSVTGAAENIPVALGVTVENLGAGASGSVMGVVIQVAPEDRERIGERVRVVTSLISGGDLIDRQSAVAELEKDGTLMLYREWPIGSFEMRAGIASLDGEHNGMWISDIVVSESSSPFAAPDEAPPEAIALEITPPREGHVRFMPPPEIGGIGAFQLEVEAPEGTAQVEFFQDEQSLGRRNRPPWTVSVSLGQVVNRSRVRAVARNAKGHYLGEDALILNTPTGQIGIEILFAPESSILDGRRGVTVAVSTSSNLHQVTLHLDDRPVARWAECPCVIDLPVEDLAAAKIITAEAIDDKGNRGDIVTTLDGGGGFIGSVKVELVELPITVLDSDGNPVIGLSVDDFSILEDGEEVQIEGFGTVADLSLSLALAVDVSGSMTEIFPEVRRAITAFTTSLLRPGDEAVLLSFAWEAEVKAPWTDDPQAIENRLSRVVPEGGTSLHDAVVRSLEQFRGRRGRQALVILTDGEDTTSRTGWETARRFAHTMRIPIFPIGLGVGLLDFSGRSTLKDLSEETGGEAFFPKEVDNLPEAYARIGDLLRSQYIVWYTSNSEKPSTQFRSIIVKVKNPDHTVKTIRGYYPGK